MDSAVLKISKMAIVGQQGEHRTHATQPLE